MAYGSSDRLGAMPREGLVRPEDLAATVFYSLGLDPYAEFQDAVGRRFAISRGEILQGIFS
jgi:hypothetical protein